MCMERVGRRKGKGCMYPVAKVLHGLNRKLLALGEECAPETDKQHPQTATHSILATHGHCTATPQPGSCQNVPETVRKNGKENHSRSALLPPPRCQAPLAACPRLCSGGPPAAPPAGWCLLHASGGARNVHLPQGAQPYLVPSTSCREPCLPATDTAA